MIRQRLLIGALSNFAGKGSSVAIWFLLTPFVLSHLGPGGYALWVLMGAVGSYGSLLDFGVGGAVIKYVAEHVARGERDAARTLVASALWLSLGLAILTVIISILLSPIIAAVLTVSAAEQSLVTSLLLLTGIDLAITIAFSPRIAVLRGLQRHDLYNGVTVLGSVLLAASTVVVLLAGGGVLGMIAVNIPVNIATRLTSTWLIGRIAPDLIPRYRGAQMGALRRIMSYSWSGFTLDIASRLHNKTDEFVIALFRPLAAVTPYALARKLGEAASIASIQCVKAIMPLASELDATDRARKLRTLYLVGSRVALGIATPVAIVLSVAGGAILTLWVGAQYAEYAGLVAVLSIASLISTSQWPAGEILQGIAKHRMLAATSLAAGAANVLLSVLLLPIFGLMGVALGTLIPAIAGPLCVVMPFTLRTLNISWKTAVREVWLPGLLPGAAAAAVLWVLHRGVESPSLTVLASWIAISTLVFAVAYLSMPATRAERQLISDLTSSGSRTVRRLLLDPLRAR